MTDKQKEDLDQIFDAMGKSGGRFVIGQVVASQNNFFGDQFVPKNAVNGSNADADEEKRQKLMATNTVIRTQTKSGDQAVDLLKLYMFIKSFFASEIEFKYEWYALRRFLEKYNLLRECDNEQFAAQMNDKEWFGSLEKCCEANEMNYYNYLNAVYPDSWVETEIQMGSRATKRSVTKIYKTFSNLELYKNQIIGR